MARLTLHPDAGQLRLPLPLYTERVIGEMVAEDGDRFRIHAGLDRDLVAQLKERSLDLSDKELQDNSSDYKRFGQGSYEQWYAKGRAPFALVHEGDDQLAAIVWLGPKPLGRDSAKHLTAEVAQQEEDAGIWHTISFRSYNPYRGKGLMKAFGRAVVEVYKQSYPDAKIWAITDGSNLGSQKLSQALGLAPVSENNGRVTMAEPA